MNKNKYNYRIKQIYNPPLQRMADNDELDNIFSLEKVRFYSYGRYALLNALECIGTKKGDVILLPSLICRDLLSAVNTLGAYPLYYEVDEQLQPLFKYDELPSTKGIIAVNYFGFPQDLTPFTEYCQKTGSLLIEDNAHGFLSRDENGDILGTRSDLGIFSFRKTLPLLNGAALHLNNNQLLAKLPDQIEFKCYISIYHSCKEIYRKMFPIIGVLGIRLLSNIVRLIRKIRTGHSIPQSDIRDETELPFDKSPTKDLLKKIKQLNIKEEIKRRREIYLWLSELMDDFNVRPVFNTLPINCVPYTFPFYCSNDKIGLIEKALDKYGLEIFNWPALPANIKTRCPKYYLNIWCIRFLW